MNSTDDASKLSTSRAEPPKVSSFEHVLEVVGGSIVRGEIKEGHSDTIDGLVERTSTSRSIVREATRILVSLGLLRAGRRVGLHVMPMSDWDVLDPRVIRWRLQSADRHAQEEELIGLRLAVEPEAARLAAEVHLHASMDPMQAAADRLEHASLDPDSHLYLEADQTLHGLILKASGNRMFVRLQNVIDEALRYRALDARAELKPEQHDVALHIQVVKAIQAGNSGLASAAMREIIQLNH